MATNELKFKKVSSESQELAEPELAQDALSQRGELASALISDWGFPVRRKTPTKFKPTNSKDSDEKQQNSLADCGFILSKPLHKIFLTIKAAPSKDGNIQLEVSQFDDEDTSLAAQFFREHRLHPGVSPSLLIGLLNCGKFWAPMVCSACDFKSNQWVSHFCHSRFCKCPGCANQRKLLLLSRFSYLGLTTKRMFHMSFGSNQLTKAQLHKVVSWWLKEMRKLDYKLHNIRVFDLTRNGFAHFHIAFLPEVMLAPRKTGQFIAVCNKVLDSKRSSANAGKIALKVIGWRNKSGLFDYFAKRGAGILGHRKEGFFGYADLMSIDEFAQNFHNRKFVVVDLPKWLIRHDEKAAIMSYAEGLAKDSSLAAASESAGKDYHQLPLKFCPNCNAKLVLGAWERMDKPPPPPEENSEHICEGCRGKGESARRWCAENGAWRIEEGKSQAFVPWGER